MRYYELAYLISPDLSEEDAKKLHQELISLIQEKGGLLDLLKDPEKINLSYPIQKREQAYLASIVFYLKPEEIQNFDKKLKSNSEILRFLLFIRKKPKTPETKKEKPKVKQPQKKAELKDIDKKLEEILGK